MRDSGDCRSQDEPLPLLLLPGTLCDARVFAPLLSRLPGVNTQVIADAGATSMRQAAEMILSQAPPCFALLGFSLGGMVALEVFALAPERVGGLALISTSPLPVPPHRHAGRLAAVQEASTMPMDVFMRTRMWQDYCGQRGQDEEDDPARALIETMASSLGHSAFSRQTGMALQRPDYRPMLATVHRPTVVIAGAEDRLCPPEMQTMFHAALPDSTMHLIPGTGHLALLQRPDEVGSAVAAWFHTVLRAQRNSEFSAAAVRQENE